MSYTIIIPARYQSQRLPGKPLLNIGDRSMLEHVYRRASQCQAKAVVIATDNDAIFEAARGFGAPCEMTSAEHQSGTDRLSEMVDKLQLDDDEVVVNVQGDEPEIPASIVDQVARNLLDNSDFDIATLACPIASSGEWLDENVVKVVSDKQDRALYFSRAPIPWLRGEAAALEKHSTQELPEDLRDHCMRHIGLYAYRAKFLKQFAQLTPAPLETIERLEQLRAMWHGYSIHVEKALETPPPGIDTQADLDAVRRAWNERAND